MHGPVPQASPPQPQVSNSITSDGTPSVARSAAYFLQLHLEIGVEPTHSSWFCTLSGVHRVCRTRERCVPAARAGCGAATNSRHDFWDIFDAFGPYTLTTTLPSLGAIAAHGPSPGRAALALALTYILLRGKGHFFSDISSIFSLKI